LTFWLTFDGNSPATVANDPMFDLVEENRDRFIDHGQDELALEAIKPS
jgi:hypothetical protein